MALWTSTSQQLLRSARAGSPRSEHGASSPPNHAAAARSICRRCIGSCLAERRTARKSFSLTLCAPYPGLWRVLTEAGSPSPGRAWGRSLVMTSCPHHLSRYELRYAVYGISVDGVQLWTSKTVYAVYERLLPRAS